MRGWGLLVLAALVTACTQKPVGVSYRGGEFYGKERQGVAAVLPRDHKTYSADSERYKDDYVEQGASASLPTVGVSELAPVQVSSPPPLKPETVNSTAVQTAPAPAPVVARTEPLPSSLPKNTPFSVVSREKLEEERAALSQTPEGTQEPMPFATAESAPADEEDVPMITPLPADSFHAEAKPAATTAAKPEATAKDRFVWPVEGKVVSAFGPKKGGLYNDGINIATDEGEPIWAAAAGEVVYAGNALKGYGNTVLIRHDKGWFTTYAHANRLLVKKGDKVTQGQMIGYVGSSGDVSGPQLHFSVRRDKAPVDPQAYLPKV